jgi:hypothetical protein
VLPDLHLTLPIVLPSPFGVGRIINGGISFHRRRRDTLKCSSSGTMQAVEYEIVRARPGHVKAAFMRRWHDVEDETAVNKQWIAILDNRSTVLRLTGICKIVLGDHDFIYKERSKRLSLVWRPVVSALLRQK